MLLRRWTGGPPRTQGPYVLYVGGFVGSASPHISPHRPFRHFYRRQRNEKVSQWPMVLPTPSRCAARRSVSVKPHARTKDGGPHAALRAADVFKSYGYAHFNKSGLRKDRHSL